VGLEQALVQQGLGLGQVVGARVPQQQVSGTCSLVLVGLVLPFLSLALLLLPLLSPSCLLTELSWIGARARCSLACRRAGGGCVIHRCVSIWQALGGDADVC
jgi:hypothetical protein